MTAGIRQSKKFIFQKVPQKGLEIIGRHLINDTCYSTEGESGASERRLGDDVESRFSDPQKCFDEIFAKFHFSSSPVTCNLQPGRRPEAGDRESPGLSITMSYPPGCFCIPLRIVTCQMNLSEHVFSSCCSCSRTPILGPWGGTDTDKFNFVRSVCLSQDDSH